LGLLALAAYMSDDALQEEQCAWKEPNAIETAHFHGGFKMGVCLVFLFAAVVWSFFFWRLYKWLWQVGYSHDQLCFQVADLDQYAGEIRNGCNALQRTAAELRESMVEVETQEMMVSDTTDGVHYGTMV